MYQQIEVDMYRMSALYVLERQKPGLIAHLTLCLLQRSQRVGSQPARSRPPLTRASTLYAPARACGLWQGQPGVCGHCGVGHAYQLATVLSLHTHTTRALAPNVSTHGPHAQFKGICG